MRVPAHGRAGFVQDFCDQLEFTGINLTASHIGGAIGQIIVAAR